MVPLYSILIRRDAHTTTPVTIPEYELPILQDIFGAENVHNAEGRRVDEKGPGKAIGQFRASDDEYERFCAKYGAERVEQVYGKSKAGLNKQVGDAKKTGTKTGKASDTGGAKTPDGGNGTETV